MPLYSGEIDATQPVNQDRCVTASECGVVVMEGERILREMKRLNSLCEVTQDIKNYLSPVLKEMPLKQSSRSDESKTLSKFSKYEIFSLKLLKQCIEQSKGASKGDTPTLLEIGAIGIESLKVCNRCSGKVPPLSFEKLLFHFASQCFNCAQYDRGLKACNMLSAQLQSDQVKNVPSLKKEGHDLLKHTFELLWKAALKIEGGGGGSAPVTSLDLATIDRCLEIRRQAFLCLLVTDFELPFVLDRILKSDYRYQKLLGCIGMTPFDHLYEFHVSIHKERDLLSYLDTATSCAAFVPSVEYLLHLAKICVYSEHKATGRDYVLRAHTLCKKHYKLCSDKAHPLTSLHVEIVELLTTISGQDVSTALDTHHESNFPPRVLHLLRGVSAGLKVVSKGMNFDPTLLTKVMYSLQTLVSNLEEKRTQFKKMVPQRETSYVPSLAFPPLKGVFTGYVECVEIHLKQSTDSSKEAMSLEQNVRSRQLSVLSLLAQILLDLLMAEDESDSADEIEVLRSSSAPRPVIPSPPPNPKRHLADCCVPLLQRSQQVMQRASKGLLAPTEHKWLGVSAYNLGLALFRGELFGDAALVLELACEELLGWCEGGRSEEERVQRSEEVQLLNKFILLSDSHRKASCYTAAMETVEKAMTSLLTNQISRSSCISTLMNQWMKIRRDLTTKQPHTDPETHHQCSPLALLDKAVSLLEPVTSTPSLHSPLCLCQAHEQLAIAHIWKALCTSEQPTESCETAATSLPSDNEGDVPGNTKSEVAVCLREEEEEQMKGEDIVSCLHSAVECWLKMWEVGRRERNLEKYFPDLSTTLHFILLTSSLCLNHYQPQLAMKSLSVGVAICQLLPLPSIQTLYQNMLARYCQLSLTLGEADEEVEGTLGGAEEEIEVALKACEDSSQLQLSGKAQMELQASFVECQLSLAQLKLHKGQFEDCRQLLVSIFQHPLLQRRSTLGHSLTARAKLLTARYLQYRKFDLKPSKEFLHYLLNEPCEGFEQRAFNVSALELAVEAVKVFRNLADHHSAARADTQVSSDSFTQGGRDVAVGLLGALREVTRVHLDQGGLREAHYYAREGAMLARTLLLRGWYIEFILMMAQIQLTRGQQDPAHTLLQQASRLMDTKPPYPSPSTPSGEGEGGGGGGISHLKKVLNVLLEAVHVDEEGEEEDRTQPSVSPLYFTGSHTSHCINLRQSISQAETHLHQQNTSRALRICKQAISSTSHGSSTSPEVSHLLGRLHLINGVAMVQDLEERRPKMADKLWKNNLHSIPDSVMKFLAHFLTAYQLCFPVAPSLLLRDVCQWLCVCLSATHVDLAHHFLSQSIQVSLSHQAVYALGKKWRKHCVAAQPPLQDVLHTLIPPPPPSFSPPLLTARTILQPPSFPPPLSHTQKLLASLPDSWTICNVCLAPTTPTSKQRYLVVSQAGAQRDTVVAKVPLSDISLLEDFQDILVSSEQSMSLREKRSWWSARRKLDKRMEELLSRLESDWLQDWKPLLLGNSLDTPTSSPSSLSSSFSSSSSPSSPSLPPPPSAVVLVLGPRVQVLPWEGLLSDQPVSRMPSLPFMAAHKCMLGHPGSVEVNPRHTFYVVNPRGDLPNTEKIFGKWFARQRGWRGVVGRAPTTQEYTTALEEHQLFVYCGHGTGREYLHLDGFQLLSCQASTLLMGCSSGRLVVSGRGDPTGMALNYLISGCPALVANLWDVTDADIDRFCQSLLKLWLDDPAAVSLLDCVARSRAACKLPWLIGTSPIVYGIPSCIHS